MVFLGRVARADRDPAHVGAPQAQGAGPGGDVVVGPDRALGLLGQASAQQGIGDAAGQLADLIEAEVAVVLDIGRASRVAAPAAVEEVDDGHVES
ncbi:hypothetical protein D3C80_1610220 [compost metagenome]